MLNLVIAFGYVSKSEGNQKTERYIGRQHHPEILQQFRAIAPAVSLTTLRSKRRAIPTSGSAPSLAKSPNQAAESLSECELWRRRIVLF